MGLPQDFQILDSEDQLRLIKRLLKLHNFDEKAFPPKQACWYINNKKDEGLRPNDIEDFNDRQEREWIKIYQIYQDTCDRAGLVDFAELLIRVYELFEKTINFCNVINNVFSIFWWMNFKTPIKSNINGSKFLLEKQAKS